MKLPHTARRMDGRLALLLLAGLLGMAASGWQLRLLTAGPSGVATPSAVAPVTALAVDTADGSLIEAAGGLLRSTDQGHTWVALPPPSGVQPDQIRLVVTSLAAPGRLYATGPGAGVVRSDDGGQAWRSVAGDLPSGEVAAFAPHSFRPDTLYAAIGGQGVFRTEDGGATWKHMDAGPPAQTAALAHSTLEGSMNTGWLYAATPDGPYLSMDCF